MSSCSSRLHGHTCRVELQHETHHWWASRGAGDLVWTDEQADQAQPLCAKCGLWPPATSMGHTWCMVCIGYLQPTDEYHRLAAILRARRAEACKDVACPGKANCQDPDCSLARQQ